MSRVAGVFLSLHECGISLTCQCHLTHTKSGSSEVAIAAIVEEGFDSGRRSGQALGPGEYFATDPSIARAYMKGGKKVLLCELLLGQVNVHHTHHGSIYVMRDPMHDLPAFTVSVR